MNFWQTLPRPFFVLAPLEDVTDAAFRALIVRYSKPAVMFTEFTSADGLLSAGRPALLPRLRFSAAERPIVAQFFTADPKKMQAVAAEAAGLGFDGVDINMGCPDRAICRQGCGAAIMENPELAQRLIAAAQQGAPGLPISVKTRTGYHKPNIENWMKILVAAGPAAIVVHGRTKKEQSLVPAHWDHIAQAAQIVKSENPSITFVGNGDVQSLPDARAKAAASGVDGVMLGRAIFGNPWLFDEQRSAPPTPRERLQALAEHLALFVEYFSDIKNFAVMKRHFKAYCKDFTGAKELRLRLMTAENATQALNMINAAQDTFLQQIS